MPEYETNAHLTLEYLFSFWIFLIKLHQLLHRGVEIILPVFSTKKLGMLSNLGASTPYLASGQ